MDNSAQIWEIELQTECIPVVSLSEKAHKSQITTQNIKC